MKSGVFLVAFCARLKTYGAFFGDKNHKAFSRFCLCGHEKSGLAEVIKLRKIKALIIDELHESMLVARPEQLKNLSILKSLSNNTYGLSIIGFGIDLARNALSMDEQFSRRFYSVQIDDWRESESFRSFLAGVEQNLPLRRPSNLDGAEVIGFLLENTSGRMDSIMNSIKSAACYAVKSGEERITIGSLVKAISTPWSY